MDKSFEYNALFYFTLMCMPLNKILKCIHTILPQMRNINGKQQ